MEEVAINPSIEPPELTQDWGKIDSCRAQTKPVHTKIQEKGAVTSEETDPDLSVGVQESPAEALVGSGLSQGQELWLQQTWEALCVA